MQNFLFLDILQTSPLVQEVFDISHKTKRVLKDAEKEEKEFYASFPHHENILTCFGMQGRFLVLEWHPFDLYKFVTTFGPCNRQFIKRIEFSIFSAVEYLHKKGLTHCDIKPENIFISSKGKIYLGDFGSVQRSPPKSPNTTLAYRSPESLRNEQVDENIDLWALGCVLEFCEHAYHVFLSGDEQGTLEKIQNRQKVCGFLSDDPKLRKISQK
uniref:Serine threonine protein kinase n=1 Tax=Marseillevirus sp. TaxID=2809551 RepID=A0AA96ER82_9VIRU|nr:serine threonine protein kinase [Marseillevirus sp.]